MFKLHFFSPLILSNGKLLQWGYEYYSHLSISCSFKLIPNTSNSSWRSSSCTTPIVDVSKFSRDIFFTSGLILNKKNENVSRQTEYRFIHFIPIIKYVYKLYTVFKSMQKICMFTVIFLLRINIFHSTNNGILVLKLTSLSTFCSVT